MDPDRGDELVAPTGTRSQGEDLEWQHRTRHLGAEIALSAFFVLLGLSLVILSGSIRAGSIPDPITSAGMARLAGVFLLVFGGIVLLRLIARALRRPDALRIPSQGENDEPGHPSTFLRPFAVAVATLLWAWGVARIGYFLATPILLAVVLRIMDVRSTVKLAVVPVGFTVIVWVLFAEVLGIGFPLGFMDTPLRRIGFIG